MNADKPKLPLSKLSKDIIVCNQIANLLRMNFIGAWFEQGIVTMLLSYPLKGSGTVAYEWTLYNDGTMDLHNNTNDEAEPIGRCIQIGRLIDAKYKIKE